MKVTKVYNKNNRIEMIKQFNQFLNNKKENTMTHLTINHYNDFEFELSYEIDGHWREDIYISVDPVDYSIHGLPAELEDYEDIVQANLLDNYGDVLDDLTITAQAEYDDYVSSILG